MLPVGVQAALAVQWLYATNLLLAGLFFWAWHPHQIGLHWETGEWIAVARWWVETAWGYGSNGQGNWRDWRCSVSVCGARSRDTSWLLCVGHRDIYVSRARQIKGDRLRRMCARAQDSPPPLSNFKVQSSCSVWRCLQAVQPWIGVPLWRGNQLARAPLTSAGLDWPAQCLRLSFIPSLSYLTGTLSVLSIFLVNKWVLLPNHGQIQVLSPLHRHNSGSARETSARVRIHCLLLSFSYPQDLNLLYPTPPREECCLQAMFLHLNLFLSWFYLQWRLSKRAGSCLPCGWKDKLQGDLALLLTGWAHLPFPYTWHNKLNLDMRTHIFIPQVIVCQTVKVILQLQR